MLNDEIKNCEENEIQEQDEKPFSWRFDDIVAALHLISSPIDTPITGFSTDSRSIQKGNCFIALKGRFFDGHDFLEEAFQKGAAVCIVESADFPILKKNSHIVVSNTLEALHDIARYAIRRSAATIIAVGGSVGKTTIRSWIAHLLNGLGKIVETDGNKNNTIGLPLSIVSLLPDTKFGVFEIGISHPGEMQGLSNICQPNVAVLTSIADAHIGNFSSIEELAIEKAQLFAGLCEGSAVVLDKKDFDRFPILAEESKKVGAEVVTVGVDNSATAYIISSSSNKYGGTSVRANLAGREIEYDIDAVGKNMELNSLKAITAAICSLFDLKFEEIVADKWNDFSEFLLSKTSGLAPLPGRGEILALEIDGKKINLMDDSYNANSASFACSVERFLLCPNPILDEGSSRKVAVIGGMSSLGVESEEKHKNLFRSLENSEIEKVYAFGELTKECFDSLPYVKKGAWSPDYEALLKVFIDDIKRGDFVLIKGSHDTNAYKIVEKLKSLDKKAKELNDSKNVA